MYPIRKAALFATLLLVACDSSPSTSEVTADVEAELGDVAPIPLDTNGGDEDEDEDEDASGPPGVDADLLDAGEEIDTESSYCEPCVTDRNCGRLGDYCVELADGNHCAPSCTESAGCPEGAVCELVTIEGVNRSVCVPALGACSPCFDEDTDLSRDPLHCGACNVACVGELSTQTCVEGACEVLACDDGFFDCDGIADNGCERAAADLNTCGGCLVLEGEPDTACGPCGDGAWACSGAESVSCVGATPDSDGDTLCDNTDSCPDSDDRVDADADGVPNGCDICPGSVDRIDTDGDSVPDGCDRCSAGSDSADADSDGTPDACDCDLAGCNANADCAEASTGAVCECRTGYTGDGLTCDLVTCPNIPAPTRGSIELTGTTWGSTATASCQTGWTLWGDAVRTCEATGAWSGTAATCYRPPGDLYCACNGLYSPGDRVITVVDWPSFPNAAGQSIGRGRTGTVVTAGTTGYPLLVQWDGWSNDRSNICGGTMCGTCSTSRSNYWMSCNDVVPTGP